MPDITIPDAAMEAAVATYRRAYFEGKSVRSSVEASVTAAAPHIAAQALKDMGEWFDRAAQLGTGERDVIAAQACYDRADLIEADHG